MHGTFPAILKCLLDENEKVAEVLDIEGKTSLHLVFDAHKNISKNRCPLRQKIFEYFPEVIRYVHSLNPLNIQNEDKNYIDVIEYVKGGEMDYSTVKMMQEMRTHAIMRELCLLVEFVSKEGHQKIKITSFTQKVNRINLWKVASRRL